LIELIRRAEERVGFFVIVSDAPNVPRSIQHPGGTTAQFWRAQAGPGIGQPLKGRIEHNTGRHGLQQGDHCEDREANEGGGVDFALYFESAS
jgi:hypothetical protein